MQGEGFEQVAAALVQHESTGVNLADLPPPLAGTHSPRRQLCLEKLQVTRGLPGVQEVRDRVHEMSRFDPQTLFYILHISLQALVVAPLTLALVLRLLSLFQHLGLDDCLVYHHLRYVDLVVDVGVDGAEIAGRWENPPLAGGNFVKFGQPLLDQGSHVDVQWPLPFDHSRLPALVLDHHRLHHLLLPLTLL